MATRMVKSKSSFKKLRDLVLGSAALTGAPAGTGVTSSIETSGLVKTVLTFVNTPLALIDTAGVVARCALKVFDFPEGSIIILTSAVNLALTKSAAGVNADWDGDASLGSAAAAGDATLTSTEVDVLASTATPQAVSGVSSFKAYASASVRLNGTTTPIDLYLNVLVDDADQDVTTTPTNLIANGTITLLWANMGDY